VSFLFSFACTPYSRVDARSFTGPRRDRFTVSRSRARTLNPQVLGSSPRGPTTQCGVPPQFGHSGATSCLTELRDIFDCGLLDLQRDPRGGHEQDGCWRRHVIRA
jgi:hypothetical protein